MKHCYLCGKEAKEDFYCFYCQRPICKDHANWSSGKSKFAYCSLCDSKFYKPLYKFLNDLKQKCNKENISYQNAMLSVIKAAVEVFG